MAIQKKVKAEITDKDFFESEEVREYLERKAAAMHKAWYNPPMTCRVLYDPKNPTIAYTDNRCYLLNSGHECITGDRNHKMMLTRGLLMHEIGHKLFTSFTALGYFINRLSQGKFYLGAPKVSVLYKRNLEELKEFIQDKNNAIKLIPIAKQLSNILEDGRIEYILLEYADKYYTLGIGLQGMREVTFHRLDDYPAVKKNMEDGEIPKIQALMQILLHYVRFGQIKGFEYSMREEPLIKMFDRIQPLADTCIEAIKSADFYNGLNKILVLLWPEIKEYLETIEDQMQNDEDTEPSSEGDSSGTPSAKKVASAIEKQLGQLQGLTPNQAPAITGDGSDNETIASIISQALDDQSNGTTAPPPYTRTTSIGGSGKGKITFSKEHANDASAISDLKKITKAVSERKIDEALEAQIRKDLNEFKENIDFTAAHRGIDCDIVRFEVSEQNKKAYNAIAPEFVRIAKNLAKRTDFFLDEDSPMKVKGQYYGKRFNVAAIAKSDYRYFSKDIILEEAPSVAVAVCLDESGSMYDGKRAKAAKQMGITIFEYCRLMDIPIAIYGHTTSGGNVKMSAYADFDKPDPNDRYRLMNSLNPQGNRDGYAIRFLKAKLDAQPASKKLLIVVSDGWPAATGYTGTAANKDLADIVKMCEKDDVAIVAAAIGEDKGQIKAIYGDKHFLDITDLSKMPILLASQVRRLLK